MGLSVKIDVTALERFAGKLDGISGASMGEATRRAVNVTADTVYDLVRPRMIANINLTDEYIKSRMVVNHAKPGGKAEAVITGKGSKNNMTQLINYDAKQLTQQVNHTNASILAAGRQFGKWPGWTKRTGDAMRGIPADKKRAGMSVAVKPGSVKRLEHGFLIQLDNGAGLGLATRSAGAKGKSNYKVRYGPSVYQLFRYQASQVLDEAREELETNTVAQVVELFEKELR